MKTPIFIDKKYLIKEYSKRKKSEQWIADQIGCGLSTISRILRKYNIYTRSIGESRKIKYDFIKKNFIVKEYATKSVYEIARKLGCNPKVIYNKMKEFGILIRTRGEANKLVGRKRRGKKAYNYNPERHKKYYCIEPTCINEICYYNWRYGSKKCSSCAGKERWKSKEYKEMMLKAFVEARQIKPNRAEKLLNKLLQKVLPKEYKINVKANIMTLAGKIPDFVNVNGQKKVIELFGDYWHNSLKRKKADKNRIKLFKKLGYETLVIWGHELKDLDKVREKLEVFNAV